MQKIPLRPIIDHVARNYEGDMVELAAFVLWEGALSRQVDIRARLQQEFEICAEVDVHWSERYYHQNIRRLYQRTNNIGQLSKDDGIKLSAKIGKTPFRLIIVRDHSPRYTYKQSVSGAIEPTNIKVHQLKSEFRRLFSKPYQVHSTNNMAEFVFQISLLLGPSRLRDVLSGGVITEGEIHRDLSGAGGWTDLREMFDVLNYAADYSVLRNFESLSDLLEDGDIDLICNDYQKVASAINLSQKEERPYKGTIFVGSTSLRVDVRFVGDGYYDPIWEQKLLANREFNGSFYHLSKPDFFFSLFYHAKVHKPHVKDRYMFELPRLAEALEFDWFNENTLTDDEAAKALRGYMAVHGFTYQDCIDKGVYVNRPVVSRLATTPLWNVPRMTMSKRLRKWRKKIKHSVLRGWRSSK